MFKELYKKSMDNVKPDELLVQRTKNLMNKELKKKPKTFYKYATAAACLIITFSLFRITFYGANNSINTQDAMIGNIEELNGGTIKDTNVPISSGENVSPSLNEVSIPNANNFINAGSSNMPDSFFKVESAQTNNLLSANDNIFIRIFKGIINWIKNLFN